MTIGFPAELQWLGWVVGAEWPEADEDSLWRIGEAWREAAADLRAVSPDLEAAADGVLAALEGATSEQLESLFAELTGEGSPAEIAVLADALAEMSDATGTEVEYAKLMFIAQVAMLAIEIAWALAQVVPTLGASLAEIPIFQAITRAAVRLLFQQLLRMIRSGVSKRVAVKMLKSGLAGAAANAAIAAALDAGIQGVQIQAGHRKDFDWGQFGQTAATEALGGLAGGPAGVWGREFRSLGRPPGSVVGRFTGAAGEGALDGLAEGGVSMLAGMALFGDEFDPRALTGSLISGAVPAGIKGLGEGPLSGDGGGPLRGSDGVLGDLGNVGDVRGVRSGLGDGAELGGAVSDSGVVGAPAERGAGVGGDGDSGVPTTHRSESSVVSEAGADSVVVVSESGGPDGGGPETSAPQWSPVESVVSGGESSVSGAGPVDGVSPVLSSPDLLLPEVSSPEFVGSELSGSEISGAEVSGVPGRSVEGGSGPESVVEVSGADSSSVGPVSESPSVSSDSPVSSVWGAETVPTSPGDGAVGESGSMGEGPGPGPAESVRSVDGAGGVGPVVGAGAGAPVSGSSPSSSTSSSGGRSSSVRGEPGSLRGEPSRRSESSEGESEGSGPVGERPVEGVADDAAVVSDGGGEDTSSAVGVSEASVDVAFTLGDGLGPSVESAARAVESGDVGVVSETDGGDVHDGPQSSSEVNPDSRSHLHGDEDLGHSDQDGDPDDRGNDNSSDDGAPSRGDAQIREPGQAAALFDSVAAEHGFTRAALLDALHRLAEEGVGREKLSVLSDSELAALIAVDSAIPRPALNDVLQKVVDPDQANMILAQTADPLSDYHPVFKPESLSGFVSVAADMQSVLDGPEPIARTFEGLRLDYTGSKFSPDMPRMFVLKGLPTDATKVIAPSAHLYAEWNARHPENPVTRSAGSFEAAGDAGPPHTGAGLPGSRLHPSPEYQIVSAQGSAAPSWASGAQMIQLDADGSSKVVAELRYNSADVLAWHPPVGADAVSPAPVSDADAAHGALDTGDAAGEVTLAHDGAPPTAPLPDLAVIDERVRGDDGRCVPDVLAHLSEISGREMDGLRDRPVGVDGVSGRELEARAGGHLRAVADFDGVSEQLRELGPGSMAILAVEHSPGAKPEDVGAHAFAVVNRDGVIETWDPATRQRMDLPEGFDHRAWAVTFDADGVPLHPLDRNFDAGELRERQPGDRGPESRIGGGRHVDRSQAEKEAVVDLDPSQEMTLRGGGVEPVGNAPMPANYPRPEFEREVFVRKDDGPGLRTQFPHDGLEPNVRYRVEGRGDFYTNGVGTVTFIESVYGGRGSLNADMQKLHPDTTYVVHPRIPDPIPGVSHAHVFRTDHLRRVVLAHTDAYALGDADRSESVQRRVGKRGGSGYDGGHMFANSAGGGGEVVNVDTMRRELNRGSGDSFYNLERSWREMAMTDSPPVIPVTIYKFFDGTGELPVKFGVRWRVGDGEYQRRRFDND